MPLYRDKNAERLARIEKVMRDNERQQKRAAEPLKQVKKKRLTKKKADSSP